jgi:hypothetical protein
VLSVRIFFVDNMESALHETGYLAMLLKAKAILADRINTDLFSMSDKPYFVEHKAVDIII